MRRDKILFLVSFHQIFAQTLFVAVPPRIVGSNLASKYVVKEGMSVSLICNVTGIPAATVTWYKLPTDIGSNKESEFCTKKSSKT